MRCAIVALTTLFLLLASATLWAESEVWRHFTSKDEMTGELQAYATSPNTPPTEPMAFPYGDIRGWLGFGCDGQDEWAYIGFSSQPNLTNTKAESGGYSTFSVRIRWDDDLQTAPMLQKWGSRFLQFQSDADAISRVLAARTVLVELNWYGSDRVYFLFTLKGSARAIATARESCRR